MNSSIHSMTAWIAERLGTTQQTLEQGLFTALVVGFLFATVHLLTMMITRWGDHHATSKSLLFSLLLHLSCGAGIVAFAPEPALQFMRPTEEKVPVTLGVESEQQIRLDNAGNTPIWEQLPKINPKQLSRMERDPTDFEAPQAPQRKSQKPTPADIDLKDLPEIPEETNSLPEKIDIAEEKLKEEAALAKLDIDPAAEVLKEVIAPSKTTVRRHQRSQFRVEEDVSRLPQKGGVDRVKPDFNTTPKLQTFQADISPESPIRQSMNDDKAFAKREGPAPIIDLTENAGGKAGVNDGGGQNVSKDKPRVTRTRTRTDFSSPDSDLTRTRPTDSIGERNPIWKESVAVINSPNFDPSMEVLKPNLTRPDFDTIQRNETARIPATYRLRNLAQRKEVARQYGGTDASEQAVEASLKWFVEHQHPDGYWDGSEHGSGKVLIDENGINRRRAGINADTGLSSLAVLAFLGAGYTHEEGPYALQIDKALHWIVDQQREDGFLGHNATRYAAMYCHGITTYALAEAYGMQSDPTSNAYLRKALEKAVGYIVKNQHAGGSWRYVPGQEGDMSMFGWQLMALKSADIAGIPIPDDTKSKLIVFLKSMSRGERNGLAGYRLGERENPTMTAEALFCKQMLGIKRANAASVEAVEYIMAHPPKRSEENLYYWYYATLSMYQYGGEPWQKWNGMLRDQLVDIQVKNGDDAGSWDPKGEWGPYGGRVYSTALATLCLEVYYRFLPLYRMDGKFDDE